MNEFTKEAVIALVKDVCLEIIQECKCHYDSTVGDEVFDNTAEVDAILKCNKRIGAAIRNMPDEKLFSLQELSEAADRAYKYGQQDAQQREEGHWIKKVRKSYPWYECTGHDVDGNIHTISFQKEETTTTYRCSKCGFVVWDFEENYCPDCGRKMKKSENKETDSK